MANVLSDSVSILLNNGRLLTVTKDGTDSGSVTSNPIRIDCGVTCQASFERGTMITVTAAPDAGSVFAGWSGGGCSGTDTCRIRMDAETSVTATFDLLEDGGHDAAAAAGGQHASYGGSVRTGYTRSRAARLTSGTFVLDESVSSLTMSGTLAGVSFQPQGPGADVTSYSGTITADFDLDAGTIRFSPGGAAVAANSGNWEPRRDGSAGREPANYGGQAGILIRLAFRDLAFSSVTDQPIPLTPAGAGVYTFESLQGLTVTAGSAAYAGFFGSGSVDLTGLRAQNSAAPGTLRDFGDGTFGLTMPIEATYTQDIGGRTATVHLSGSITGIALPDGASAR